MGERDLAEREIERARARMTELADELSRRVSPARVKAEIREEIRERSTKAKEAALKKTVEVKDRALASPTALGVLGGVIGASIGAAVARRTRASHYSYAGRHLREGYTAHAGYGDTRLEPYGTENLDVGYARGAEWSSGRGGEYTVGSDYAGNEYTSDESPLHGSAQGGAGLKERVAGKASELGEKGREMKDRVAGQTADMKDRAVGAMHRVADTVREHTPSRGDLRSSASHVRDRAVDAGHAARSKIDEQPLLVAVGAVVLGGLAALLIPVSNRERQAFRPLQDKVREKVEEVGAKVETSIRESGQQAESSAQGASSFESQSAAGLSTAGEFSGGGIGAGLERSETSSDLGPSGGGIQSKPLEERKPEERLGDVARDDSDLPSIH